MWFMVAANSKIPATFYSTKSAHLFLIHSKSTALKMHGKPFSAAIQLPRFFIAAASCYQSGFVFYSFPFFVFINVFHHQKQVLLVRLVKTPAETKQTTLPFASHYPAHILCKFVLSECELVLSEYELVNDSCELVFLQYELVLPGCELVLFKYELVYALCELVIG